MEWKMAKVIFNDMSKSVVKITWKRLNFREKLNWIKESREFWFFFCGHKNLAIIWRDHFRNIKTLPIRCLLFAARILVSGISNWIYVEYLWICCPNFRKKRFEMQIKWPKLSPNSNESILTHNDAPFWCTIKLEIAQ